jgi:hypothetical protein
MQTDTDYRDWKADLCAMFGPDCQTPADLPDEEQLAILYEYGLDPAQAYREIMDAREGEAREWHDEA